MTETKETTENNKNMNNKETSDSLQQQSKVSLLKRINRVVHKITNINNNLVEIYDTQEDLNEEIETINTNLDILKSIDIILVNCDTDIGSHICFSDIIYKIENAKELQTLEKNLEDSKIKEQKTNKARTIDLLEKLSVISSKMKNAVERTKEVYDATTHLEEELKVINNQIKLAHGLEIMLSCECLGRDIIKNCSNSVAQLEKSEALRRIEIYLLDCE